MQWVLERGVFEDGHAGLAQAAEHAGHSVLTWEDGWWEDDGWPRRVDPRTLFHGSLGNAHRIRSRPPWNPGAYFDTPRFHCSAWYPRALRWLLNRQHAILPAAELVADPASVLRHLGDPAQVFVRPDSPLKPFSGRVLERGSLTLVAYYRSHACTASKRAGPAPRLGCVDGACAVVPGEPRPDTAVRRKVDGGVFSVEIE